MGYVVSLCDGMADYPVEELSGETSMQAAHKPHMDSLAKKSQVDLVKAVTDHLKPDSDVANLSVLGHDPAAYYAGRSPLEAGSIDIDMKPTGVSFRYNLVALSDESKYVDKTILDYCADNISTEKTEILIKYLAKHLDSEGFRLYSGVGYRHRLIWNNGTLEVGTLTPPYDITGKSIREYIPTHPNAAKLYDMMVESYDLLKDHPVNRARVVRSQCPADSMWLWGEGIHARLSPFGKRCGLRGSVISAVDLLEGIGKFSGMHVVHVEGATGYIDTNFKGKTRVALKELADGQNFVYIHMEASDEYRHRHGIGDKVKSIEYINGRILKLLLEDMEQYDDYGILVASGHPAPLALRTHTNNPVPFLVYREGKECPDVGCFSKESATATGLRVGTGHLLIEKFIKG